ncbi:hypothetical protein DW352_25510 [Pseudolabrys taiwanensis]|uniref:PhnA-like protein n=1 Tax=Pseudolabrys taiwanensis TaxID=331696 RepID=A0A346A340_9HYPH|nr:hypothetical protein [Pseudolabrys taiwanensis]AXK83587.1 hypothetical protein DW352_25510 [Pseudolabrys taiwanensis]
MSDTAIVGENVEVIQATTARSSFTWSVVIAGALAAWAVAFIFISLGTGIGLTVTSPYSGPSAGTMSIGGAIWLLFSETVAFTVGGYLAGRLRTRNHIPGPETKFRDAAHGFMAWVVGASLMVLAVMYGSAFVAKTAADAIGPAAGAAISASTNGDSNDAATGYYVDRLFRTDANAGAATGGQQQSLTPEQRSEAARIVVASIRNGSLSDADKDYLARLVAARTGIPQDQAVQRVNEVQNQAAQAVREAADKARKAGAYISFWSFMALLFGAVAATLAGVLGGELRDEL